MKNHFSKAEKLNVLTKKCYRFDFLIKLISRWFSMKMLALTLSSRLLKYFNTMEIQTFNLRPSDEFIELIKLLKIQQWVQSGGHAKIIIEDGLVNVNDEQEFRKRRKLRPGDIVAYDGKKVVVAGPVK